MIGRADVIADQQLLIQFLTGTQATELNSDIAMWVLARSHTKTTEVDHLLRQLDNLYRLAHIQHEHITALPHSPRLNHQLRGFGDGHKIAGDIRMSDGDRPTLTDLLTEKRNNRARRPQHITETHHGETGLVDPMHRLAITEQHRS